MEKPTGRIAVIIRNPQGVMFYCQVVEQIALLVFQIIESDDAVLPKDGLSHLPFNPPDIFILLPKQIKPNLVTLLLDLSYLVINTKNNVSLSQGESLHLAILSMLTVFAGIADKRIFVKIKLRKVIIKTEIHAGKAFPMVR